jgi:histone deacetylase HOS3
MVLTPAMVAKEYFQKDLELHKNSQSRVAIIVHDSCYGHRFSRPRTAKSALASIVERPERIHATILGASIAYIRLGGRHFQGQHPPHPDKLAPAHSVPFEIRKTSRFLPLNHKSVTHVHGQKWMEELQIMCDSAEAKLALNGKELVRPIGYGKDENGNPLPKLHEGDLYLCAETLAALQGCLGGVCDAVDLIFGDSPAQRAFVCIRPPGHHCSANVPSGFCWLNNVHIGITYGAINHDLTHAAIIDFDLHHGDGSQAIAWDHNQKASSAPKNTAPYKKVPIGYYSIHDINSFPCEAGDPEKIRNASVCIENAHGQSIWNVHLENWGSPTQFWNLYRTRYLVLLEKTRIFLRHHTAKLRQAGISPKGAIFLSAGFDASEWEMAGMQRHGVNVPTDFYAQFTADVVKMSQEEDLGVEGRVISVLEGGYSDRALTSGVLSHVCGLVDEPAVNIPVDHTAGLAASVSSAHNAQQRDLNAGLAIPGYDPLWWNVEELKQMEAIVLGNMPQPPPTTKGKASSTYSSPTHASTNRMTEVARERRSLSAQLEARLALENEGPPPPPDVDWAVAAYELSRILIPADRQTLSCQHEDLNAESTRVRKERQSMAAVPMGEVMQLRERRPKPPPIPSSHIRSSSRTSNRRTTIASVSDLPDPSMGHNGGEASANVRPRRRSSASSKIVADFQDMKLDDESNPQDLGSSARPDESRGTTNSAPRNTKAPATQKPKASAITKPAPKPRSSPRKVKPISRPGSSSSNRTADSRIPPDPVIGVSRPPPPPRQTSQASSNADDMESLTNGMKKVGIKLKMPSAEEHTANQEKIEVGPKQTVSTKPARKPAAPRAIKSKPSVKPGAASKSNPSGENPSTSDTGSASLSQNKDSIPQIDGSVDDIGQSRVTEQVMDSQAEVGVPPLSATNGNEAAELNGMDTTSSQTPATLTAANPPTFNSPLSDKENTAPMIAQVRAEHPEFAAAIPVNKEEDIDQSGTTVPVPPPPAAPLASTQQDGVNWARPLTPNKKTKDDLPKFTSSSPIPFAKSSYNRPSSAAGTSTAQTQEKVEEMDGVLQRKGEEEKSVWDIPDTPIQPR